MAEPVAETAAAAVVEADTQFPLLQTLLQPQALMQATEK
jgi:hypothetical protein